VTETRADTVAQAYTAQFGNAPAGIWAAPGRVNVIGEHTDYNEGFVMPFALDQRITVAAAPRRDGEWSVTSLDEHDTQTFTLDDLAPGMKGWQAYVAGVVWALMREGYEVVGADLVLTSDVPLGAGLSSSAALECSTLTALVDLSGLEIEPMQRAMMARRCENEFVGAPTGLMDQAASTLGQSGHALFLDCRSYDAQQVPLGLTEAGLEILVLDTKTAHALVDSEYATRRQTCEAAARLLGAAALRDVLDVHAALRLIPDPVMARRVRHVVTENGRVLAAAQLLTAGRIAELGPLLDASHASMRDDFEITVPTVDLAVETAREAGALGARMTGGGFGGCIIALVEAGRSDAVAAEIADAFAKRGFHPPSHFLGVPSVGARRLA
jgi:galactokinase